MIPTLLTCDRLGGFIRAAIWRNGKLDDLYVDRIETPDLSGALVRARAVRVTTSGKSAWFDAGLAEKIYVENTKNLRAGDIRTLTVRTTCGQGKASKGFIIEGANIGKKVGLVTPPPAPWQKALADLKSEKVLCRFASREDWKLCENYLANNKTAKLDNYSKQSVHPDLDDAIDALLKRSVSLSGSGELVIEPTEALVAIDINAGDMSNSTAVNLKAMQEIARQIRLRNLGGIIVIDALKMKERTDKAKVLATLSKACANDPAGVEIFGITKLGLIEITRTRRGPSLQEIMEI